MTSPSSAPGHEGQEPVAAGGRAAPRVVEDVGQAGGQRPQGAGHSGDRVVRAEAPHLGPAPQLGRDHHLLERGERPGLDDLGRERTGEPHQGQRPHRAAQREDDRGAGQDGVEHGVAPTAAEPVAVPGDHHGHQGAPGDDGAEHQTDLPHRQAAVGEAGAQQHGTEPVPERPQRLRGVDAPDVWCGACLVDGTVDRPDRGTPGRASG